MISIYRQRGTYEWTWLCTLDTPAQCHEWLQSNGIPGQTYKLMEEGATIRVEVGQTLIIG